MSTAPIELIQIFEKLGISEPEEWAHSEHVEGIDQVGRATILRSLADLTSKFSGKEGLVRLAQVSEEASAAIHTLKSSNADLDAVGDLCREAAYMVIWNFLRVCSGMEDPDRNPANVQWALLRVDPNSGAVSELQALYESWHGVLCDVVAERRKLN